jgi:hypothetical protein
MPALQSRQVLFFATLLTGVTTGAYPVNLALDRPTFATDAGIWSVTNLVDEALGTHTSSGTWHFSGNYATLVPPGPYVGGVDLAGAGNTVSVKTIRIIGGETYTPKTWTLQSRDSATDPLNGTVDSGWTDTGVAVNSSAALYSLTHTFATPVDTRALRFRITDRNNTNDRIVDLQVFSEDPHAANLLHQYTLDPVLSREDGVTIGTATNLQRLRDDDFTYTQRPGGVSMVAIDYGQPGARAAMNYDYTFPNIALIDGLRFYFQIDGVSSTGGALRQSDLQVQVPAPGGVGWVTVPGGSVLANDGLISLDFTGSIIRSDRIRLQHTVYDVNSNPRSGLYAYEIEAYGLVLPEPASAAVLLLGTTALLLRRRCHRRG